MPILRDALFAYLASQYKPEMLDDGSGLYKKPSFGMRMFNPGMAESVDSANMQVARLPIIQKQQLDSANQQYQAGLENKENELTSIWNNSPTLKSVYAHPEEYVANQMAGFGDPSQFAQQVRSAQFMTGGGPQQLASGDVAEATGRNIKASMANLFDTPALSAATENAQTIEAGQRANQNINLMPLQGLNAQLGLQNSINEQQNLVPLHLQNQIFNEKSIVPAQQANALNYETDVKPLVQNSTKLGALNDIWNQENVIPAQLANNLAWQQNVEPARRLSSQLSFENDADRQQNLAPLQLQNEINWQRQAEPQKLRNAIINYNLGRKEAQVQGNLLNQQIINQGLINDTYKRNLINQNLTAYNLGVNPLATLESDWQVTPTPRGVDINARPGTKLALQQDAMSRISGPKMPNGMSVTSINGKPVNTRSIQASFNGIPATDPNMVQAWDGTKWVWVIAK